ncbi:MAG TPA: hypothetical protein VF794_13670 [Archangium sp.]|jgi:type II secretory pathway pseudopilin PulG|uniref:hypothetical protein n=1 Tax=Archangium sp. TaxID=1872627 RepID=UPI002EDAE08B
MKKRLGKRGSVLLLVVVLLAVISLLAAAAVTFSQSELGAARNEKTGDELLACADAGRQYMLSQLSVLEKPIKDPSIIKDPGIINVDMNSASDDANCPSVGEVPTGMRCARSGHIGRVQVTGVTKLETTAGGNREDMKDITNTAGNPMFGGVPHKIVVHCKDETGRETEVEFVVRFGL